MGSGATDWRRSGRRSGTKGRRQTSPKGGVSDRSLILSLQYSMRQIVLRDIKYNQKSLTYNNQSMVAPTAEFNKARSLRHSLSLSIKVEKLCVFIELTILHQKSSIVCCSSGQNVPAVDENFAKAFKRMSQEDQIAYYVCLVGYAEERKFGAKYEVEEEFVTQEGYFRNDGRFSNSWEKARLEICGKEQKVTIIGNQIRTVSLRNYLIRKSGASDKFTLVLMSIYSDDVLRIGFGEWTALNKCYSLLFLLIKISHTSNTFQEFLMKSGHTQQKPKEKEFQSPARVRPNALKIQTNKKNEQSTVLRIFSHDILAKDSHIPVVDIEKQNDCFIQSHSTNNSSSGNPLAEIIKQKANLDIFFYFMPQYHLEKLETEHDYHLIRYNDSHRIFQHNVIANKFKLILFVPSAKNKVVSVISNVMNYPQMNPETSVADVKRQIRSENSLICYQSHHQYSQFCYPRDYLYLRHLFNIKNRTYIIDKSIDSRIYPPFTKVTRGQILYGIWMIEQMDNCTKLVLEIQMHHNGTLSKNQNETLTVRYLEGITKINDFFKNKQTVIDDQLFNYSWDIGKNEKNLERNTIRRTHKVSPKQHESSESIEDSIFQLNICEEYQEFYSVHNEYQEMGEPSVENLDAENKEFLTAYVPPVVVGRKVSLDKNNKIIVPSNNIQQKWILQPYLVEQSIVVKKQIWGDHLEVDNGIVRFKSNETLTAMNAAYKHLMSSVENDLIRGDKIHSLQLPVDAYNKESFLEVLAKSFSIAPKLVKGSVKQLTPTEKLGSFITIGFSSCLILAIDLIQKSFDPLLGETYQGWINGFPIYCEQITPTISSFFMEGVGYTIYGNIEPKVTLSSLNKLVYELIGFYTMQLSNGEKIYFYPPRVEISGVSFGEKVLNLREKCTALYPKQQLYAEIVLDPFSESRTQLLQDTIKGGVYKIKGTSIDKFQHLLRTNGQTRPIVANSDLISPITGRWTSHLNIGNISYYSTKNDRAYLLREQDFPLNSNCNYRQDIIYRREQNIIKSQIAKQKLQESDRVDSQLRSKVLK